MTRRRGDGDERQSEKTKPTEQVLSILRAGEVIAEVAGDGTLHSTSAPFTPSPGMLVPGLEDSYFGALVTDFENEHGEIPKGCSENARRFYSPHGDDVRPLGRKRCDEYTRSPWLYGSVLVCEKEDNVAMLRERASRSDGTASLSRPVDSRLVRLKDLSTTSEAPRVRTGAHIRDDRRRRARLDDLPDARRRDQSSRSPVNRGRQSRPVPLGSIGRRTKTGNRLREIAQRKSKTGHVRRAKVADYIRERDLAEQQTEIPTTSPIGKNGCKTTASNSTQ